MQQSMNKSDKKVSELKNELWSLEAIVENSDIQIAYLDPEFNFIKVNSLYAKGCGYRKEDLIGHNHFELFPNSENKRIFEGVRDSGHPIEFRAKPFEYSDQPQRGITYWDWTLKPVKTDDGNTRGLLLSLNEVTRLQRSKIRVKTYIYKLLAIMIASIFVAEFIVMHILSSWPRQSQLFTLLFDAGVLTMIIVPISYFFLLRPLMISLSERIQAQESLSKSFDKMEIAIQEKTYKLAHTNLSLRKEIDNRYQIEKKLQNELKRSKHLEEKLRQSRDELELRVAKRTGALVDANKKLQAEILKRKSTEEALESERTRLFTVLDELPASVHLVAQDHTIRFANRYFREQFGDIKAHPCHKTLYNNDNPCEICNTFEVFQSGDPGEYEGLRANGKLYKIYNYPFKDIDSKLLVLQLGIEITEQKKAEEALKKSEQRFRILVNSMDDTVFTIDRKQRFLEIYGNLFERIGLSASYSSGKAIDEIFNSAEGKLHSEAVRKAFKGENILYEWSTKQSDGIKYIQNSLSPINTPEGHIEGVVGVARDISSKKLLEQHIIQTEKLMTISQLTAMISHEFRNSLTSVRMILELQLESENLNKSEIKSLSVALSSVTHMEKIVTQLLNFSRPAPLKFQNENINTVVEESTAFIRAHLVKHNITLITSLEANLPIIRLDLTSMKECLINLFLNAIQAVKDKNLKSNRKTISIKTKKYNIGTNQFDFYTSDIPTSLNELEKKNEHKEIFLPVGTPCIVIEIEDSGIGIKEPIQKRIFDPFFTETEGGTGLGLSMVKRTVNAHGGVITVNSRPGKGTAFKIRLPILKR